MDIPLVNKIQGEGINFISNQKQVTKGKEIGKSILMSWKIYRFVETVSKQIPRFSGGEMRCPHPNIESDVHSPKSGEAETQAFQMAKTQALERDRVASTHSRLP